MVLAILSLDSCSTVEIKNQTWCVDQGTLGAHCANTLTPDTFDIPQPDWDNRRFAQFCTNDDPDKLGAQLSEMKKELEEICSIYNVCTYEKVAALRSFLDHMRNKQRETRHE